MGPGNRGSEDLGTALTLTALFDRSLTNRASAVGLEYVDGDRVQSLTFGEVEARANRMANELSARGLGKGDRLCLHLPNRVEFIDLFLACTRLGVILVPMNILYRDRELKHIIGDSEPKAIVVAKGTDVAYPSGVPLWEVESLSAAASSRGAERPRVALTGEDSAVIIYTSGTTGTAKGAVLSHDNLGSNGMTVAAAWRITDADRYLAVLPLFHVHGLGNGVHSWLISGNRMRLVERFDQKTAVALFTDFKPTLFFGVPTMYVRLLDPAVVSDEIARAIGKQARLFVSGSAPLPSHVLEAFRSRYGHTILERYGMSEALMIMSNPYDGERRPGTVGRPMPGVSARLVAEDGSLVTGDEVGEVEMKSPHLFSEYWRRPDATEAAFHDGWFRTGDLAARSRDGYYTLRGRKGDLIICGGFNIYPREIEELLLEDPRVKEVAVVGAPDPARGEVPVAYVVSEGPLPEVELTEMCRKQLASFKVPRSFTRVESLPRTALGKIQKHLLPRADG